MNWFTKWSRLFIRWAKVLGGKSYYHQPQCLGKVFRPNELDGYLNNLTGKTHQTSFTMKKRYRLTFWSMAVRFILLRQLCRKRSDIGINGCL